MRFVSCSSDNDSHRDPIVAAWFLRETFSDGIADEISDCAKQELLSPAPDRFRATLECINKYDPIYRTNRRNKPKTDVKRKWASLKNNFNPKA